MSKKRDKISRVIQSGGDIMHGECCILESRSQGSICGIITLGS